MEPWDQTKDRLKQAQKALELWDQLESPGPVGQTKPGGPKGPEGSKLSQGGGAFSRDPHIDLLLTEVKKKLEELSK